MADAKISADPTVTPSASDTAAGLQGGVNVQYLFSAIKAFVLSALSGTVLTSPVINGVTHTTATALSTGYIGVPSRSLSANTTTVLTDAGRSIIHTAADDNPRTFTIDSNANVAHAIDTVITFINLKNTLTIAITSDTMTLANTATTGSRTLAVNGIATAIKVGTTSWLISGTGLT